MNTRGGPSPCMNDSFGRGILPLLKIELLKEGRPIHTMGLPPHSHNRPI